MRAGEIFHGRLKRSVGVHDDDDDDVNCAYDLYKRSRGSRRMVRIKYIIRKTITAACKINHK